MWVESVCYWWCEYHNSTQITIFNGKTIIMSCYVPPALVTLLILLNFAKIKLDPLIEWAKLSGYVQLRYLI